MHTVRAEFDDCDRAGIVFFPNFSRWMDSVSHPVLQHGGLPPWRDLAEQPCCVGAPFLKIHTKFFNPANPERINAIPIPEDIRVLCSCFVPP